MTDAERMCANVRDELRPHAVEIAESLEFMRVKLTETRKGLANQAVVIPYDNGGGQTGIRANPAFREFNALMKTYTTTLERFTAMFAGTMDAKGQSALDRFKVLPMKLAVGDE